MSIIESEKYAQQIRRNREFLSKFLIFPHKTRKVIYSTLMALPLNHSHFIELTKPFKPLPEHTTNKQTAFIVNALIKLYPSLGNQWLPGLVYPFIKLFQEDSIMCFQSSLTFLLNWYQPVFQNYPNPSKSIIDLARKYLSKLQNKMIASNYTLGAIFNPMILVCLTDVLNKDDSLQVMDFLVTNPFNPELFVCVAIQIVAMIQDRLCNLSSVEQISVALRKQKKLNIQQLIQNSVQMSRQSKKQLEKMYSKCLFPLNKGRYPVYEFIKDDPVKSNDAIEKVKYEQMNNLNCKFDELSKLINTRLKQGMVANSYQIANRYHQIEAQTTQYLNKMRKEHQMKLKALKQIEDQFKNQILHEEQHAKNSMNQQNLKVIQRRGRLEKEILKLQNQAHKIRELEQDLVKRINSIAEIRKNEIKESNKKLRQQQRSEELYNGFYDA